MVRLWGLNPKMLCRKHLLGEHNEMHLIVGSILKGISIKGHILKGNVETDLIRIRHEELVEEMILRGYNHKSELPHFEINSMGKIDLEYNLRDLLNRCSECNKRFEGLK